MRLCCIMTSYGNISTCLLLAAWKVSVFGVFRDPYFPAFGLNTERHSVSLRIQSECGKIRITKTPNTKTFHAMLILNIYTGYIHLNTNKILFQVFLYFKVFFYSHCEKLRLISNKITGLSVPQRCQIWAYRNIWISVIHEDMVTG